MHGVLFPVWGAAARVAGIGGGITARGLTAAASSLSSARPFKYGLREFTRIEIQLQSSCERQTIQRGDQIWRHSDCGRQKETERGKNSLLRTESNTENRKLEQSSMARHAATAGSS